MYTLVLQYQSDKDLLVRALVSRIMDLESVYDRVVNGNPPYAEKVAERLKVAVRVYENIEHSQVLFTSKIVSKLVYGK